MAVRIHVRVAWDRYAQPVRGERARGPQQRAHLPHMAGCCVQRPGRWVAVPHRPHRPQSSAYR
eukprot:5214241-Pleurochrysis_carterae.AAC.1